MANRNPLQSLQMREQVPNVPGLGNEIPLSVPEHIPEQEMTPSPVAPNENEDSSLGLFYRVDVESLNDWTTVTQLMRGGIGYRVQEPNVTEDFKQYFSNLEKWPQLLLELGKKGPGLSSHDR